MIRATDRQKIILVALLVVLAILLYRFRSDGGPKTAPLTYQRGAVATSPVRGGTAGSVDPLSEYLARRAVKFPGVSRNIFLMEDAPPKPKRQKITPPREVKPKEPPVHVMTPEEMAAEAAKAAADRARADMARFRYLGYLTEKDDVLFLEKDGELFILKSGDTVLKNYQVKETTRGYVILLDNATGVEMRVPLSGASQEVRRTEPAQPQPQSQAAPQQQLQQQQQQLQTPLDPMNRGPRRRRYWKK